jgi:hypothetical protein
MMLPEHPDMVVRVQLRIGDEVYGRVCDARPYVPDAREPATVIDAGHDPSGRSGLGPVRWRIERRGLARFYCSTFVQHRTQIQRLAADFPAVAQYLRRHPEKVWFVVLLEQLLPRDGDQLGDLTHQEVT